MKRLFEIEWDDDSGPMWMNVDNLRTCIRTKEHIGRDVSLGIVDVTPKDEKNEETV
ncbi:hypothetical protein LCGC14_1188600 [marine sediment metagenome]|uniref:Uncharacterized protein n=1 Tax=marine sediment metagenome TaxID=412755 RepID=A0A0F9M7T6_9ZZZZ